MNKRDILKLIGTILLGAITPTAAKASGTSAKLSNKKRIVVIGAGLAGLAAARVLKRHGHEVVIVEARDRIGGRISTSHQWPDLPLDLGATWIHGVRKNPLTDLANQIQARRVVTSYDRVATYTANGSLLSAAEEARLDLLRKRVFRALRKAQNQEDDISIQQAVEPLLQKFKTSAEDTRYIQFVLSGDIEQEYSGSTARLSTQWYDEIKEFKGEDALFVQGFKVITDYLAQGISIELSQVVKEIQWGQPRVRVITEKTEFLADHVVVTLPLGVLQNDRVRFTPELPKPKRNAIAKLGMGVLNKCYLRFPQVFWPDDVDWLEYVSSQRGEWTEWVSFKRVVNMPVLLGFNAADRGREIEAWSDEQIVASAMQTLKAIFGANIPQPIDYQITRWATDPFALGAYSFNALGAKPKMRDVLANPLGERLFFAGEASHKDYFGTAHGAYLSGLRVAKQILAR